MNGFKAFVFGAAGGAIGAAVWAGIAAVTGMEIGWIAWGVGFLVGVGVALGNGGEGSTMAGVIAAGLAILSVAAGKYAMVQLVLPDEAELVSNSVAALEDTELVVSYVADEVVEEFAAQGKPVNWPEGADPYMASQQADYPSDVWTVAQTRWNMMTYDDQQAYKATLAANIEASASEYRAVLAQSGFISTFGLLDLVFFGLAIATAYKIASTGSVKENEAEPVSA